MFFSRIVNLDYSFHTIFKEDTMKKWGLLIVGLLIILTAFSYSRFGAKEEYQDTLKSRYAAFWSSVNDLTLYTEENLLAVPELIDDLKKAVVNYNFEGKTQDVDTYEKQWLSFYERFDHLATLAIDHQAAAEEVLSQMEDILLEYIPEVRTLGIDPVKLAEYGIEMKRIDGATFQMPVSERQEADVKVSTFYSAVYPVNAYVYLQFIDYLYNLDLIKERGSYNGGEYDLRNGDEFSFADYFDVYREYIQVDKEKLYLDSHANELKNAIIIFNMNYTSLDIHPVFMNWLSDQFCLPHAYDKDGNYLDETGSITEDITRVKGFRLPTEAEWWWMIVGEKYRNYIYGNDSKSLSKNNPLHKNMTPDYLESKSGIFFPNYEVREILGYSIDIEKFDERDNDYENPIIQKYFTQRADGYLKLHKNAIWSGNYYFLRPVLSLQNIK